MQDIAKPLRQRDYGDFSPTTPIVIDNGSFKFRMGWAGESDPRITFRNVVHRPRHKTTGEIVTIVGDHDPMLMKYFDCTRSFQRSAFDSNVVYQFELMEYIFDFGFERLGCGSQIDHPILITECPCNPVQSRCRMAELLFETYGIPSVAFGVDAAFSYKYNQRIGACDQDGLVVCSGLTTSHVIPFVSGEPIFEASCRTNVGGYHITDYLKQLLSLKYPHHSASINWDRVEDLKMEHCYIAEDYVAEVKMFQRGKQEAEDKTRIWQLPFTPPPKEEAPSEEEIARKAAIKEKQGQRLREMAAAKRTSKIMELENELQGLEFLIQQLENVDEDDIPSFLSETGYVSRQEIESAIQRIGQSLRRIKGESIDIEEKMEPSLSEKYPLLNVPDDMLTSEQLKEKRKQSFLKTTAEGRLRAKQKRFEEELQREKQNQEEEERRLENPELYLEVLRSKHKELSEKVEQRKRLKTNWNRGEGDHNLSGGTGRGERLNAAQRERMRLLTTAAFDRGKGEDTFGIKDEDWQLYKLMSRDNDDDDDGQDEDEMELARITSRLQDIDPIFVAKSETSMLRPITEVPHLRSLTAEDFQIVLGMERIRCPEILFQPIIVGVDQTGLDEMVGVSMRRLPDKSIELENRMTSSILITGGSCLFSGLAKRLEVEIRKLRPFQSPIRIIRASDPVLDAWHGASMYASDSQFPNQTFSREDYYEKGEDWLRGYKFKYVL